MIRVWASSSFLYCTPKKFLIPLPPHRSSHACDILGTELVIQLHHTAYALLEGGVAFFKESSKAVCFPERWHMAHGRWHTSNGFACREESGRWFAATGGKSMF